MRVAWIPREQFVNDYFDFQPGQHVQVVAPTGGGKSELFGQLSQVVISRFPDLHYVSFCPKAIDDTARRWQQELELSETETWPPKKRDVNHVLWPKHVKGDDQADEEHLRSHFGRALDDQFWSGDSITFVDDCYYMAADLALGKKLDRHWYMGRSHKASLFTALQKPSGTVRGGVSSYAYDSPTHVFFGKDSDDRNLKRISELAISQLDPKEVMELVKNLPVHKFGESAVSDMLYINRSGPYVCQVGV